jgi:hypothetical protein
MKAISETWQVAGRSVPVSYLDNPFWPEDGLTKGSMLHLSQAQTTCLSARMTYYAMTIELMRISDYYWWKLEGT